MSVKVIEKNAGEKLPRQSVKKGRESRPFLI